MTNEERKAALEAIIYAADEPATIEQLTKALGEEKLVVQASLDELVASYAVEERGIEIRAVAGGYKLYTKPQQHDVVRRFIKSLRPPLRLTMPALETLAVIAYKQPVTSPEISEIRGVNTSGVINTLLEKRLITTAGRKEVIGRPILYKTSKEFLMRFGLSDLEELPSLKEFEALAREALGTDEGVAVAEVETTSEESLVASEIAEGTESAATESNDSGEAVNANEGGEAVATTEAAVGDAIGTSETVAAEFVGTESLVTEGAEADADFIVVDAEAVEEHSHETVAEAMEHVKEELAEAEAVREHEALATAEGMPSGELDEDPPRPAVKSTAAGE